MMERAAQGASAEDLLGLGEAQDLKANYRRLANQLHPDKHRGASATDIDVLELAFDLAAKAYKAAGRGDRQDYDSLTAELKRSRERAAPRTPPSARDPRDSARSPGTTARGTQERDAYSDYRSRRTGEQVRETARDPQPPEPPPIDPEWYRRYATQTRAQRTWRYMSCAASVAVVLGSRSPAVTGVLLGVAVGSKRD
jgi:hypothetical protein